MPTLPMATLEHNTFLSFPLMDCNVRDNQFVDCALKSGPLGSDPGLVSSTFILKGGNDGQCHFIKSLLSESHHIRSRSIGQKTPGTFQQTGQWLSGSLGPGRCLLEQRALFLKASIV